VKPGDNETQHLAGSLVYRTGTPLVSSQATRRNAPMFIAHLVPLPGSFVLFVGFMGGMALGTPKAMWTR
jgi:hypothetical protein